VQLQSSLWHTHYAELLILDIHLCWHARMAGILITSCGTKCSILCCFNLFCHFQECSPKAKLGLTMNKNKNKNSLFYWWSSMSLTCFRTLSLYKPCQHTVFVKLLLGLHSLNYTCSAASYVEAVWVFRHTLQLPSSRAYLKMRSEMCIKTQEVRFTAECQTLQYFKNGCEK
jgi:hypothetical protein